jgi:hypothetical protein
MPTRSPIAASSCGVCRTAYHGLRRHGCPTQFPRKRRQTALGASSTLVVMPEECQSIPITEPKDWNEKG